jgi:hypothetical protein
LDLACPEKWAAASKGTLKLSCGLSLSSTAINHIPFGHIQSPTPKSQSLIGNLFWSKKLKIFSLIKKNIYFIY